MEITKSLKKIIDKIKNFKIIDNLLGKLNIKISLKSRKNINKQVNKRRVNFFNFGKTIFNQSSLGNPNKKDVTPDHSNTTNNNLWNEILSRKRTENNAWHNSNKEYLEVCEKLIAVCAKAIVVNFEQNEWRLFSIGNADEVDLGHRIIVEDPKKYLYRYFVLSQDDIVKRSRKYKEIRNIIKAINKEQKEIKVNNYQHNKIAILPSADELRTFRQNIIKGKISNVLIFATIESDEEPYEIIIGKFTNMRKKDESVLLQFDSDKHFNRIKTKIIDLLACSSIKNKNFLLNYRITKFFTNFN